MSRARHAILMGLAAAMVCVVLPGWASAAGQYHGFTGTETIAATSGAQLLEMTFGGQRALIKCEKGKGTGTVTAATGEGGGEFTIEGCAFWLVDGTTHDATSTAATCTVANPVLKLGTALQAGNTLEVLSGTGEAGAITEFKVTGASCVLKGTYKIYGELVCAGPKGRLRSSSTGWSATPRARAY